MARFFMWGSKELIGAGKNTQDRVAVYLRRGDSSLHQQAELMVIINSSPSVRDSAF